MSWCPPRLPDPGPFLDKRYGRLGRCLIGTCARNPRGDRSRLDRVYALFPELAGKKSEPASRLSGGEQQILAVAHGMLSDRALLILDEPSAGLAPRVIERILEAASGLSREGVAILLVEQNVPLTLEASQRVYLMEKGAIHHQARSSDLKVGDAVIKQYLGV